MVIKIECTSRWQIRTVNEGGYTWTRRHYRTPSGALRAVTRLQGQGHRVTHTESLVMLLNATMHAALKGASDERT